MLSPEPYTAVSPVHLRSLEQNPSARPKPLVPSIGLDSTAEANKVIYIYIFLICQSNFVDAFIIISTHWNSFHLTTEIAIHYEEQIWRPSSLRHSGADLTTKWQHFSFRKLSGYAVYFCQLLRTGPDLWSKCITTNCRFALEQFQCSVTPGLLLFQEL